MRGETSVSMRTRAGDGHVDVIPLVLGQVDAQRRAQMAAHVLQCATCRSEYDELAATVRESVARGAGRATTARLRSSRCWHSWASTCALHGEPTPRFGWFAGAAAAIIAVVASVSWWTTSNDDQPSRSAKVSPLELARGDGNVGTVSISEVDGETVMVVALVSAPKGVSYRCRTTFADGTTSESETWPAGYGAWIVPLPSTNDSRSTPSNWSSTAPTPCGPPPRSTATPDGGQRENHALEVEVPGRLQSMFFWFRPTPTTVAVVAVGREWPGVSPVRSRAMYLTKKPSGEYSAASISNPLRWIIGSSSHVNVECSSRMCSSRSARTHSPSPSAANGRAPRLDAVRGFGGLEAEDDVPQARKPPVRTVRRRFVAGPSTSRSREGDAARSASRRSRRGRRCARRTGSLPARPRCSTPVPQPPWFAGDPTSPATRRPRPLGRTRGATARVN